MLPFVLFLSSVLFNWKECQISLLRTIRARRLVYPAEQIYTYVFYNMETYCLVFPFLYEGGLGSWKGKFEKHERRKRQNIKEVKEGNWNITYLNQHSYWEFQWQHEIIISEKMFARRTFSWFSFSDRTWMVASQKNNLFVVLERSL